MATIGGLTANEPIKTDSKNLNSILVGDNVTFQCKNIYFHVILIMLIIYPSREISMKGVS